MLNIFRHIHFIYRDYDEPTDEEECSLIAYTYQFFSDVIDIYSDMEVADIIKIGYDLTKAINDLKNKGYYVYAEKHNVKLSEQDDIAYNA